MPHDEPENGWSRLTKWIVGLTGVLVVVPSLINSGKTIWEEVNKVPRTDAERINVELFKKYWQQKPISETPLRITRGNVNYQVNFSVYGEGDVFIQYGKMTQWFAFPSQSEPSPFAAQTGLLISKAYAGELASYQQINGGFTQQDSFDGGNAIREKMYFNGLKERQIIDMRTGIIIDQKVTGKLLDPKEPLPTGVQGITIDLDSKNPMFKLD